MKTLIENFNRFLNQESSDLPLIDREQARIPSSTLGQTRRELEAQGIEAEEDTAEDIYRKRPITITKLTFVEPNGRETTTLSFRGTKDEAPLIDTKSRALEEMQEQELGGQSYTFKVYRPGFYRNDPNTTLMFVENVPMSMIDSKEYAGEKEGQWLQISKEGFQKLGFSPNKYGNFDLGSHKIDAVPETVQVTVGYNPRTGDFMTEQAVLPKVVDASSM